MNKNTETGPDLAARHEAESRFHDHKYGEGEGYPRHYAVRPTYPVFERMLEMAGDLSGRSVLEYGCGEGWITRELAARGARVDAFDISAEAVRKTHEVLAAKDLADRCTIRQMGGEKLDYADASFDVAFGFAIIHHLDLALALPELHRVLKPGGVAWFAEPLATNPLINVYRRLTPQYRTADEKPLNLRILAKSLESFSYVHHTDFYVTALLAVGLSYLPWGVEMFRWACPPLMSFDRKLLSMAPGLGRFAWYTVLEIRR